MEKILIFKSSTDATVQRLFSELAEEKNKEIDCLIQHSQIKRYQEAYPSINFMDIQEERFGSLPSEIMEQIFKKRYDRVYVTLTGIYGYNFWNVIEIVDKVRFKNAFFYNCNGEKRKIPKKNIIKDTLCRVYIKWISLFY